MQIAKKENKPVIYSAGATKVLRFTYEKGKDCFTMHWHERIEILYIRKGSIEYVRGNKTGVIRQGQALIIPPRLAHYAKAKEETIYDVLMFDLRYFYNETDVCKKLLYDMFEGNMQFEAVTEQTDILECIDFICYKTKPDSFEIISKIYQLLHLFMVKGIAKPCNNRKSMAMREAVDYIEQNFDKEISTDSISAHFGYTPEHFCRKFKKATGLTPVLYLKIYRLEKAYAMIKDGDCQICEVAQRCGFSDANYFTRCFSAHYKHPPSYFKNL